MSSNTPQGPAGNPEYLGSASGAGASSTGGSGKKLGVLGGAAIGVVAMLGLGGWGAYSLLSGGSQPAEAIPANAIGYLSVDLDPSASQKIEAFRILKKFPGIEKELDIGDRDDLRRWVFDAMHDDGVCEDLDYAKDVEPWIGDRIAVAGVPGDGNKIAPLVALQVTDQDAATSGVEALANCGEVDEDFGFAFAGDYVLIAETEKKADSFADDAEQGSLADDEGFAEWTDAAGGSGIVTMYASAEAPGYVPDLQSDLMGTAYMTQGQDEAARANDQVGEMYKDFDGMAGVLRFEDGAVEMEFAGKGLPAGLPASGEVSDNAVSTLPESTGAAISLSLSDGWVEDYLDQMSAMLGEGDSLEDSMTDLEAETGLSLPEDIETLFGDSVAMAVDSDIDFEALSESEDPSELPAGIKVHGDPDEILPVVDKIKASFGANADALIVDSGEDDVAFGFDQGYVEDLLADGRLSDDETFANVVPEADKASGVFYVNFDAGDGWANQVADLVSDSDPDVRDNVDPLDALGMSAWVEDDVQHALFRMTTD